jgi:hypothetical protein
MMHPLAILSLSGHTWLDRHIKLLRDGNAPNFFDAAQRCRPITVATRDDDSDEFAAPVLRKETQVRRPPEGDCE